MQTAQVIYREAAIRSQSDEYRGTVKTCEGLREAHRPMRAHFTSGPSRFAREIIQTVPLTHDEAQETLLIEFHAVHS